MTWAIAARRRAQLLAGTAPFSCLTRTVFAGAIVLLAGEAAWANCSPQSQSGVIATCTGVTLNQGEGPENTSASGNGYGDVSHVGITVTVDNNASVTGSAAGIVADGLTVTNNTGATIAGGTGAGIYSQFGSANVTNSGTITSAIDSAISASAGVTAINNTNGVITGAQYGIVSFGGNADVTNSGSITGTGADGIAAAGIVTVTNNTGASITGQQYGIWAVSAFASIFNAGTITGGTSAIFFQGGDSTLTLGPGSVISGGVTAGGSNTFQLGGTGTATFDVSVLDTQYQGFTTFNKISNSVWTLTGTSIYGGPVNVNAGTLIVDGNISSVNAVTVNAGGTLSGNGIVGTTTVNAGGTLAPGNATALLTVQGSLTLAAASNYVVEVSPANATRTDVTGAADLGGATVRANFAAGSYVVRQYTIVNATGGLGGSTFGGVANTNLSPNFRTTLSYDADNAYLNVLLSFIPPPGSGLSGNQQNVGDALVNFFNRTGGIPLIFSELTAAGLTQISGETATGTQQTTFDAMTQFMGLLSDPSIDGRGSRNGTAALPYADEAMAYAAKRKPNDALAAIYRQAPPPALAYVPSWSVWAAAFGGTQTTDGDAALGSNTATSRIFGAAVGADYRMSPDTIVGFAMAGGGTHFSVANGGTGRTDLFQAGAFLRHQMGPAYVSAALAYGWQDVTTERTVGLDRLQGRFDANAFSGRVESGYRFATAAMGITPYAAAQFTTVLLPGYGETATSGTDTFALTYGAKDVTAPRTELGLRADKSFVVDGGVLTLRGRAAWAHDYNSERSVGATFQTLPGASFVVNGAATARNAALTTASAEMKFASGWAIAATFDGEFSDVTRSYAGKGVVRYAW